MFTETELREAMQHSAERADHLIEQQSSAEGPPFRPVDLHVPIVHAPPVRRRTWVPVAAAAAVAAVAGGGLMLAARPAHHSPAAPQRNVAAATPTSGSNGAAVAAPRTAVKITNLVTVPGTDNYTLDAGTETLNAPGGIGGTQLMALPASGFDPAKQLTGAHAVSVAGTPGYAGKALLYLIDPNDAEQASKAGAPRNTVAWQVSGGTWLVLQNFMADEPGFADLPEPTLIHDAGQLQVTATPAPVRSGYRAGWLPAGLTLTSVSGSVGNPASSLRLTAGRKSIDIQLSTEAMAPIVPVGGTGIANANRHIPGYWVSVHGSGYDQATVQRVLDGLDFSRLSGPQSGWWTFDQAVNG